MIQLYNSLTGTKEILKTISPGNVKMYVCGVTVYDRCHMGHARTYVAFDIMVRYLRYQGYKVEYVRNITDIDDKIIKKSKELSIDASTLVQEYTEKMYEDFDSLNILRPDFEPKATECINEIIDMISNLLAKGHAYLCENGDVCFKVASFENYGRLSGQDMDALMSGVRVAASQYKQSQLDFVLWKAAKKDEPSWSAPWSEGRPGWHIECSAMARKILGDAIDIHGGGSDLKFPHHENEIAQSEAANCCSFSKFWLHSGMVKINSEKMSKSLNNFFTINEVLKKYSSETIRYFLMTGHYRSDINYTESNLDNASNSLDKLYSSLRGLCLDSDETTTLDKSYKVQFEQAMNNDFNTPEAIAVLFGLSKAINKAKSEGDDSLSITLAQLLVKLGGILGILQENPDDYFKKNQSELDIDIIEQLISKRTEAKLLKNWKEADILRDKIEKLGFSLEDTASGTIWKKN